MLSQLYENIKKGAELDDFSSSERSLFLFSAIDRWDDEIVTLKS